MRTQDRHTSTPLPTHRPTGPQTCSKSQAHRNASNRPARPGHPPTVQVGERRWVVPTARLLELLGLEAVASDGEGDCHVD